MVQYLRCCVLSLRQSRSTSVSCFQFGITLVCEYFGEHNSHKYMVLARLCNQVPPELAQL